MPRDSNRARHVETLGIIVIALLIFFISLARFWRGVHFHTSTPNLATPAGKGGSR